MRITHPRPQLGRQKFIGVEFIDGVAEVDDLHPETEASLVLHGYTIDRTPDLEDRTVEDLRVELEGLGYEVKKSWRKQELVERIAQHHDLDHEKIAPTDGIEKAPDGATVFANPTFEIKVNRDHHLIPADAPLSVSDLRALAEVDDDHDVWLAGATDTKITDDWTPVADAEFRTAPSVINGA